MYNADLKTTGYMLAVLDAINYLFRLFTGPLFLVFTIVATADAQQTVVNLKKNVAINATEIRFDSLLSQVSKQTGVRFSVNTRKFPPSKVIHVDKGTQSLDKLLAGIKEHTGISYRVLGSHIIFIDAPPVKVKAQQKPAPVAATGIRKTSGVKQAPPVSIAPLAVIKADTIKTDTLIVLKADSVLIPPRVDSHRILLVADSVRYRNHDTGFINLSFERPPAMAKNKYVPVREKRGGLRLWPFSGRPGVDTLPEKLRQVAGDSTDKTTTSVEAAKSSSKTSSHREPFLKKLFAERTYSSSNRMAGDAPEYQRGPFIKGGLVIEETYYVNPTIQLGFPFLYGMISWSSNLRGQMFRYGAGTSIRLSDNWRMHLQGSVGGMKLAFDSGTSPLKSAEMQLQKLAFVGEKKIGENLRLHLGVTLNMMSVDREDVTFPFPGSGFETTEKKINQHFKPLYTIRNFSPVHDFHAMWVGAQVGIFYNLSFKRRN